MPSSRLRVLVAIAIIAILAIVSYLPASIIQAIIPAAVPTANKQGSTGSKFLIANGGFTSGNTVTTDSNGNAIDGGVAAPNFYTTGLLGKYRMFDSSGTTLLDSSGSGNNGALVGSPTIGGASITINVGGTRGAQYLTLPSAVSSAAHTVMVCADFTQNATLANFSALWGTRAAWLVGLR